MLEIGPFAYLVQQRERITPFLQAEMSENIVANAYQRRTYVLFVSQFFTPPKNHTDFHQIYDIPSPLVLAFRQPSLFFCLTVMPVRP